MKGIHTLQTNLEKIIGPFATVMSNNTYIKALTEAFLGTIPITIGTAVIAVLANLPIAAWTTWLNEIGLYTVAQQMISTTLSMLAVYVAVAVGYSYTKNEGENPKIGALISLASFISFMPILDMPTETGSISVLTTDNFGSNGIFVAIIIGLLISSLFCKLMKSNLKIKLPSAVPSMVSESLTPTLVVMILFTGVFAVKYGFSLTSYGSIFQFISEIVSKPILSLGTNPLTPIIAFTFMNFLWFFGIHPSPVFNCFLPILISTVTANIEAMMSNQPMPYVTFQVVFMAVYLGGNGNTLGLCIATLFAKSEKYKSLRKLVIPANIFNINEPIIFGFPTMLNPIYFIPMVGSSALAGGVVYMLSENMNFVINPAVNLPWVTPGAMTAFLTGGIPILIIWFIALGLHFAIYLPFFLMDDAKTYKEEQASLRNE